jgi:hypothetical protein
MHEIKKKMMSDSDKIEQFARITAMQSLSESLQSIGESPIKEKRLSEGKYPTSKMKRIEKAVKTRILNIPENLNSIAVSLSLDAELLKLFSSSSSYTRICVHWPIPR